MSQDIPQPGQVLVFPRGVEAGAELRAALKGSMPEEAAGKGKHFRNGREAIRWLESQ